MPLIQIPSTITKSSNSIDIYRGQSKDIEVSITTEGMDPATNQLADLPVPLNGCVIFFSVKQKPGDDRPLIYKDSTNVMAIEFNNTDNGIAVIHIDATDTSNMEANTYVFDVWIKLQSGKVYPVIPVSEFIVKDPVTIVMT